MHFSSQTYDYLFFSGTYECNYLTPIFVCLFFLTTGQIGFVELMLFVLVRLGRYGQRSGTQRGTITMATFFPHPTEAQIKPNL